jgi:hypothetical protein
MKGSLKSVSSRQLKDNVILPLGSEKGHQITSEQAPHPLSAPFPRLCLGRDTRELLAAFFLGCQNQIIPPQSQHKKRKYTSRNIIHLFIKLKILVEGRTGMEGGRVKGQEKEKRR